jgi:hypothetical protein
MSEIKTVTHEGKVYQIGKDYLFSAAGKTWIYDKLTKIDKLTNTEVGCEEVFCTQKTEWSYIKKVPAPENIGTITPAPIELIDGAAYMFDSKFMKDAVGIYDKSSHRIYFTEGLFTEAEWLENIRLMTVESK